MGKRGTKIRKATEVAAISQDEQLRNKVDRVGAAVGTPAIQRGHHAVAIIATSIDRAGRPLEQTLRKLTRAERLHRSGAIDDRQAKAIAHYVEAADSAYAGCVRVADYGGGTGGSSPTGAADAAHGRMLDGVGASYALDLARSCIPQGYVAAFDRIVLDNHPLGLVGADMWPSSSVGAVSAAVRDLVRTCADHLVLFYGLAAPDEPRMRLMQTMGRLDRHVRGEIAETGSLRPISDAVEERAAAASDHAAIHASPTVIAAICQENGVVEWSGCWAGLPVIEVEHWQFGWIIQEPASPAS